jgi:hypothetical protein
LIDTIPSAYLNLNNHIFPQQPTYTGDFITEMCEIYEERTGEDFANDYRFI